MYITLQLRPDVSSAFRQKESHPAVQELLQVARELGIKLEPLHPGEDDPRLARHFRVTVPDHASAQRAIVRLQQLRAVEAAYLKPPDELP